MAICKIAGRKEDRKGGTRVKVGDSKRQQQQQQRRRRGVTCHLSSGGSNGPTKEHFLPRMYCKYVASRSAVWEEW